MKEEFQKEFAAILAEAIEHFNPEIEDDTSVITIVADVDNEQLLFGGLKLREDLEGEGIWDENSRVFYTAESKYVQSCYKELNKDYEEWRTGRSYNYDGLMSAAYNMGYVMGDAIVDEGLREILSGELLYGWCHAMGQNADGDNFYCA